MSCTVDQWLEVGEGHRLRWLERGAPDGVPAVWVHGGPGSGFGPGAWDLFDLGANRIVCYDQRAAGLSTPHAGGAVDWSTIDMARHVADLEQIREHLGIEQWIVAGASWGSVLALAYAQRQRERVIAVVGAAVSTGGRAEIDHLTEHGATYAPARWQRFHDFAHEHQPGRRLVEAYRRMVMDPDPLIHAPAAAEWCRWEDAHVDVDELGSADAYLDPRFRDARFRLGFARQVTHCWAADSWLGPDELVDGARTMAGVPCTMVHGARDRSSPLGPAQALHDAWPQSQLLVTNDGHGGSAMWHHVATAIAAATTYWAR